LNDNRNTRLRQQFNSGAAKSSERRPALVTIVTLFVASAALIGGGIFFFEMIRSRAVPAQSVANTANGRPSMKDVSQKAFADPEQIYLQLDRTCIPNYSARRLPSEANTFAAEVRQYQLLTGTGITDWHTGTKAAKFYLPVQEVAAYLDCALSTQSDRFCHAPYRAQIVDQLERYALSKANYDRVIKKGGDDDIANIPKRKTESKEDYANIQLKARNRRFETLESGMKIRIKGLFQNGYLGTGDFGWFGFLVPEYIKPLIGPVIQNRCS
jgi:hypothetical protein